MQYQKCSLDLYVDFLTASQKQFSGMELSKASPQVMAHDAKSRWLSRKKLTPKFLWQKSQHMVDRNSGYLILDDCVLDKPHAQKIAFVKKQYSGNHHRVVKGIGLVNLLWTDKSSHQKITPIDYRIYEPTRDGKTKNDHGRDMLKLAKKRAFSPDYVLIDCWYSSIGNIKAIDSYGWKWIGQIQSNCLVSLKKGKYVHVSDLDWIHKRVHKVWLRAYDFVLVSKTVAPNNDVAYLATRFVSYKCRDNKRSLYLSLDN